MTKEKLTTTEPQRMEDLMKKALENAPKLENEVIVSGIEEYLSEKDKDSRYLLLLSTELNYYQVFDTQKAKTKREIAEHILDYLSESYAASDAGELIPLENVVEIDNSDSVEALDLWVSKYYFQLAPFDWGVEEVGAIVK